MEVDLQVVKEMFKFKAYCLMLGTGIESEFSTQNLEIHKLGIPH